MRLIPFKVRFESDKILDLRIRDSKKKFEKE
jgi:hypothetical protein